MKARFTACWNTLSQRWCWSLILTLVLILFIWLVGPLIAISEHKILAGIGTRFLVSGCLLLIWGMSLLLLQKRDQRRQLSDEQRTDEEYGQQIKQQIKEELGVLKDRLQEALQVIRNSSLYGKRGDRFRYELPWYLILGATGSGKTSLLEHSGVEFPINDHQDRLTQDVGQTRYCDWFYANNAILIDSAGRFTEQEGMSVDAGVWQGFLQQLKLRRRRRPLNGVILALDMDQLLHDSEPELEQYARTVRERMQELQNRLTLDLPVYVVLTKTDRLSGFTEFFETLSREDRDQVMGVTFRENSDGTQAAVLRQEFEELLRRLNSQVLQRMHQERDVQRRGHLLEFPLQLASIGQRLALFIELAFAKTRYHKASRVRGIYFTSAPEVNSHLDASTAAIGRNLALPRHLLPSVGETRGFFIRQLLEEVIFPESELASLDQGYEKKLQWRNRLAYASVAGLLMLGGGLWANSFLFNTGHQQQLASQLEQSQELHQKLPPTAELAESAPLLNSMRQAKQVYPASAQVPWLDQLGLYQGEPLNHMSQEIYNQQLRKQMLPRIKRQLEEQITANLDKRNTLSNSLRAYLMLSMHRHLDKTFLQDWLAQTWSVRYRGQGDLQRDLAEHFAHLLAIGFEPVTLNNQVLISARNELRTEPTAELVYRMLQEDGALVKVPDFSFASVLTSYPRVFEFDDYHIPGLYTRKGYQQVFLARGIGIVKDMVDNNWVLGDSNELTDHEIKRIYREVEEMYFRDYTEHWSSALTQLQIKPSEDIAGAGAQLQAITSSSQPLLTVLKTVRENSLLMDGLDDLAGQAGELAAKVNPKLNQLATGAINSTLDTIEVSAAKQALAQHFQHLNVLLPDGGTPAPALQNALDAVHALHTRINGITNAPDPEQAAYGLARERMSGKSDELGRLRSAAEVLPATASQWLLQLVDQSWHLTLASSQAYIQQQYASDLWRPYRSSIAGRYPFGKQAEQEVALGDFNAFFAQGGRVDSFYKKVLSPFVGGNRNRLYVKQIDGQGLPLSGHFLNQMARAYFIQQAFFSENGNQAKLQFKLEPLALSSSLLKAELNVDGSSLVYEHGPILGKQFSWPSTASSNRASIALHNLSGENVLSQHSTGTWSLFRLLDQFEITDYDGNNVLKATLQKKGFNAQYLLASRHSPNPLNRQTLIAFGLPGKI
ncbi:MAG: type VI secretion system membrane subunit TssM [Candidatus Oceanisphaera merdipullorum]|nr:type VI secretion system membrane subunit TssM [Candidatus Oceanisphaera merdipullorum]